MDVHTIHATADFNRAAELTPRGVLNLLAQAEATKRVRQLSKRLPCGNANWAPGDGACL
jgi:hypothetical protein